MKVIIDDRAVEDLEGIYRYIATDNPRNARMWLIVSSRAWNDLQNFLNWRAPEKSAVRESWLFRGFRISQSIEYRGQG